MSFVLDRWGVKFDDSMIKNLTCFPELQWIVRVNDFGFCDGSRNFGKLLSVSCEDCFAWIGLNPLSGKILNNDSVPCVVSWFTLLVEVSWEVSVNTVLPWFRCHFRRMFQIWFRRTVCADACTLVSSRLSVNCSGHSGRSRKRSPASRLSFLFWFVFWVFEGWSAPI